MIVLVVVCLRNKGNRTDEMIEATTACLVRDKRNMSVRIRSIYSTLNSIIHENLQVDSVF